MSVRRIRVAGANAQHRRTYVPWSQRGWCGPTTAPWHSYPEVPVRPTRDPSTIEDICAELNANVTFLTNHEYNLLTETRSNPTQEYGYQREYRLDAAEALQQTLYDAVERFEKSAESVPVAEFWDLAEETHSVAGKTLGFRVRRAQRLHDFAWENKAYIMGPGATRDYICWIREQNWTGPQRAAIHRAVMRWPPPEMRPTEAADYQKVAAFDVEARMTMLRVVDEECEETKKAANAMTASAAEKKDLCAYVDACAEEMRQHIDPTLDISEDAIKNEKDSEKLRLMAKKIYEYNWDGRIQSIYNRTAELLNEGAQSKKLLSSLNETVFTPDSIEVSMAKGCVKRAALGGKAQAAIKA